METKGRELSEESRTGHHVTNSSFQELWLRLITNLHNSTFPFPIWRHRPTENGCRLSNTILMGWLVPAYLTWMESWWPIGHWLGLIILTLWSPTRNPIALIFLWDVDVLLIYIEYPREECTVSLGNQTLNEVWTLVGDTRMSGGRLILIGFGKNAVAESI